MFDLAWWGAAVVAVADQRIDTVNPAFARLHGYSGPNELSGRLFKDLLLPEHATDPAGWPDMVANGGSGYESEHRRADGSTFPVLVNVIPLRGVGEPSAYVVTVQDLSDLKRTEERLRRAQRMEAVGRLAGGVAHEVNNMMTIILGFGDLLARALDLPADRKREVEEIVKAAVRAGKITTQLLAFSRQQVHSPAEMRLGDVVEEIVPMLRLMLPANVRIETAGARVPSVVRADRIQLEQVLINLTFNARDAMPGGGTIRVLTESRRLDGGTGQRLIGIPIPEGRYGLISVIDTGQGMDRDTVMRVFEPFFTTKRVGEGTGLGLSTVYGIVKQSGGYVWVQSTPGQGTTFTVCLPEVREPTLDALAPMPENRHVPGRAGKILVIEDEGGVRELAVRILSDRGHRVLAARNGAEAMSLVEESGGIDLAITDVIVPDVGTGDLVGELRRRSPGVAILYMSGYPYGEIVSRHLLPPDQPFVQKPFTGQELIEAVDRIMPPHAPGGGPVTPALISS